VASGVALVLAAALSGAPQVLASTHEGEHRCHCPAGAHRCACPRCAAKTAAASQPSRAKAPPCHGGSGAAPAHREARSAHVTNAPCVSAGCHSTDGAVPRLGATEPFVLDHRPSTEPPGRAEALAPVLSVPSAAGAAPEPPPPRA
jgi:hypothetical protein